MLSILIVDDEVVTIDKLHVLLKKNYFSDIYTAYNGKDALQIISEKSVEIVLVDIRLPDINGLELIQMIKSKNPNIEIIIITGYGSQDVAIQSLRKGAIDYIEKPIKMEELLAAIGRAMEKWSEKQKLTYKNTILIVDDEIEMTELLKYELLKTGYEVYAANTYKAALSILEKNKIDVMIVDIVMQDINGIEILKHAKKLQQDIEGIVITGFIDNEQTIKALRAGAFDYILKPIHLDMLMISIEKALDKIKLYRNNVYRNRELKLTSEIITKVNEELEKRIEERSLELSQTQAQLFQTSKLATLGEMSAGLAHELNQPLGAIALTTKYLKKLCDLDQLKQDELVTAVQDIDSSIKRMSNVIQHIRTFARQDTLKFIEVDINQTVDAALKLLGEQLRLHEIEITKDLAPHLPCIIGEPFQLEQVWLNLLTNARDATDTKALQLSEAMKGKTTYKKKLIIRSGQKGEKIFLEISDNGIGMDEATVTKIFDPFFTTKEVGKALGLGMAISYGIIESHKGKIEIVSKEGEGSTIMVLFDRTNGNERV